MINHNGHNFWGGFRFPLRHALSDEELVLVISEGRSRSVRVGFARALPCHHDGPQWPHGCIDLLKNTSEIGCRWDRDADLGNPARDALGIKVRLEALQHAIANEPVERDIDLAADAGLARHRSPLLAQDAMIIRLFSTWING